MHSMRRIALAGLMVLGAAVPALACQGKTVVLSTDGWKPDGSQVQVKAPGELEVHVAADTMDATAVLQTANGTGVCADVAVETSSNPADSGAGLSFWRTSPTNYYFLEVKPTGQYRVVHVVDKRWYTLIPATDSPVIKQGLNQWNEAEIEIDGSNSVAIYLNGQKVDSLIAHRPSGETDYGDFAEAPVNGAAVAAVKALRVVK